MYFAAKGTAQLNCFREKMNRAINCEMYLRNNLFPSITALKMVMAGSFSMTVIKNTLPVQSRSGSISKI